MDILRAMFPGHAPALLQSHLDRAHGVVDIAVDAILSGPSAADASTSTAHSRQNNGNIPTSGPNNVIVLDDDDDDDNNNNNKYKRGTYYMCTNKNPNHVCGHSNKNSNQNDKKSNGIGNNNTHINGRIVLVDSGSDGDMLEAYDFDEGEPDWAPPPGPSTTSQPAVVQKERPQSVNDAGGSSSSATGFEAFHQEQERAKELQRLKAEELMRERKMLVDNFIGMAKDMFENISVAYLEKLMEETRPKVASEDELVDKCMDTLFGLKGQYPKDNKGKRKRSDSDEEGDEEEDIDDFSSGANGALGGTSTASGSGKPRDFTDCKIRMSGSYTTDSAKQLYQDFPKVSTTTIRTCLMQHSFHYVPSFDYMTALWKAHRDKGENGDGKGKEPAIEGPLIRLVENKSVRKNVGPPDLNSVDPDFAQEWQWLQSKIAKETREAEKIKAEADNLQYYTDMNELVECGCCFDDVPPNRMAQCEEGHLFCLSCARQAAEVELGYQRTVLKCMTPGCKATFTDSEAIKFLARPVFQGLQRARQQNELKMAGIEGLVECPFCSYAAVVENEEDKEFRCQAPKCKRVSCRLCRAPTHIPQSCEEYKKEQEKNNVLTVQHKVEEQMSEALIRECTQCATRFFKDEGCNKMTCPKCHSFMCYVCKTKIKDYSHFDQTPANSPAKNPNLCRLWDNTIERNESDVRAAAQRTMEELQRETPDLVAHVRLDIPQAPPQAAPRPAAPRRQQNAQQQQQPQQQAQRAQDAANIRARQQEQEVLALMRQQRRHDRHVRQERQERHQRVQLPQPQPQRQPQPQQLPLPRPQLQQQQQQQQQQAQAQPRPLLQQHPQPQLQPRPHHQPQQQQQPQPQLVLQRAEELQEQLRQRMQQVQQLQFQEQERQRAHQYEQRLQEMDQEYRQQQQRQNEGQHQPRGR